MSTPPGDRARNAEHETAASTEDRVIRVLCVDDERPLLYALAANLRARGYEADLAETGEAALQLASTHHHDAVILDLGLPGLSGIEVIEGLRAWLNVPIIVLSARDSEDSKIAALDAGADDYVTKPFSMGELLARLRVALRRTSPADPNGPAVVVTDDFTIDFPAHRLTIGPEDIRLTPTEWQLVEVLIRHEGKLVTSRSLLETVWGPGLVDQTNYLRVYMAGIRRKLEPVPSMPRYFITEPGVGYRFERRARVGA